MQISNMPFLKKSKLTGTELDQADIEDANISGIIYEELENEISSNAKKLQKKSNFPGENFAYANAERKKFL